MQRETIIGTAERLIREIGFQKTTVADIARELRMSPANVYRFFGTKSEINAAVAREVLGKAEALAGRIASEPGSAARRLRKLIMAVANMNELRFVGDRKLHEMVEIALREQWPIVEEHIGQIDSCLRRIIADGVASNEFAEWDPETAAKLVRSACIRFLHPGLVVDCGDAVAPSLDEMLDFCLAALERRQAEAA